CPDGWHIPSALEWQTDLFNVVKNQGHGCEECREIQMPGLGSYRECNDFGGNNVAKALATKNGWGVPVSGIGENCFPGVNPQDNNTTSFNWMPAGYRIQNSSTFVSLGDYGFNWSSTQYQEQGLERSYYARIKKDLATTTAYGVSSKSMGASIRCIKDY
ncbi:MAG: FISUMP domain-containing protein, partial [Candidatus ainarchaeum sp.]|nr:FISUMP domain-containing protein [Candidatus ainarchaeum sp.]